MAAFINSLREKNGLKRVKTVDDYIKEVKALKEEIKRLETIIYNRDLTYNCELNRVLTFLRKLTQVKGSLLKKAVSLIVYWDKFSWIDAIVVERLRQEDKRIKAFFDLPRDFGNVKAMEKYVGTDELKEALGLVGYEDAASRIKARKKNKKKGAK